MYTIDVKSFIREWKRFVRKTMTYWSPDNSFAPDHEPIHYTTAENECDNSLSARLNTIQPRASP